MVARGRAKNGVVVLNDGVRLPEGQEVTVLGPATAPDGASPHTPRPHSVLDIPAASLGPVLSTPADDNDLLGEMLEGRP